MRVLALEYQAPLEGVDGVPFSPKHWTQMNHFNQHFPTQTVEVGPVSGTWLYCVESFFGYLKGLVKSRSQPIANICHRIQTTAALRLLRSCMDYKSMEVAEGPQRPVDVPRAPPVPGDEWDDVDGILKSQGDGGMNGEGRMKKLTDTARAAIVAWMKGLPEYRAIQAAWNLAWTHIQPAHWRALGLGDAAARLA